MVFLVLVCVFCVCDTGVFGAVVVLFKMYTLKAWSIVSVVLLYSGCRKITLY